MLDEALLVLIFGIAIAFGFSNGLNDAANTVAAPIGSRAIPPRMAIGIAATFNLVGAIHGAMVGAAVAKTIGKGILTTEVVTGDYGYSIVIGAIVAAIIWVLAATYLGLPISVSHSLVAGLVGAGIATGSKIGWEGFGKTLAAVVCAPVLGFIGAFMLMIFILWLLYGADAVYFGVENLNMRSRSSINFSLMDSQNYSRTSIFMILLLPERYSWRRWLRGRR